MRGGRGSATRPPVAAPPAWLASGAEVTGEIELADGRRMLRYRMPALGLSRTAALSRLEAATLRFALARAERRAPDASDRALVEDAARHEVLGASRRDDNQSPSPSAESRCRTMLTLA